MLKFKKLINKLFGNPAVKIGFYYFLFGFFWILFSDWLLSVFVSDAKQLTFLQTLKGWIFITGTTFLIFFLVYREIYRKNQLIKILNEGKKWYNLLIHNIPDIDVFLIDINNLCIMAQGHTLEKVGLFPESIQNKHIHNSQLSEAFKSLFQDNFSKINRGLTIIHEFNMNDFWFELRGVPVYGDSGEIIAGLLIFIDITRQKQNLFEIIEKKNEVEALYQKNLAISNELTATNTKLTEINTKIRENEQKYRLFFENINDGASIFELTKDLKPGYFLEVNKKFADQLGYSPKELEKLHPAIVFNQEQEYFNKTIAKLLDIKSIRFETKCINKQGDELPFEVSIYLLNIEDRNLFFAITRNISEQKKYIEELKKSKAQAELADKLKGTFLINMSHEIRTPLNGILGFSEILGHDDLTPDKRHKFTEIVRNSSSQLLKLFDNIIDLSRIETGQLFLTKKEFHLNDLIDELNQYISDIIASNNKLVQCGCSKGLSDGEDLVFTDRIMLTKVFKILAENAVKFTDAGEINFGYQVDVGKTNASFFIEDTGIGIPSDKISIIFDRFRQADEDLTRQFGGAGLGLSIAKGIVDNLGGEISVQSGTKGGARFEFILNITDKLDNTR
jgi:PAS domain S-box-containing protein